MIAVHQPGEDRLDHVDALLVGQAPDEGDDGDVGVELAGALAGGVVLVEEVVVALDFGRQEAIALGVPLVTVDAVENSVEVWEASPARVLQAPASLHRDDLVPVARRHSHHPIRHLDPSLEQLDLPVVEELVVVGAVRQPQVMGIYHGKVAAVSHVVDVEHGAGRLVAAVPPVVRRQDQRH
eukprot:762494-Hanusia_phi.AAC.4